MQNQELLFYFLGFFLMFLAIFAINKLNTSNDYIISFEFMTNSNTNNRVTTIANFKKFDLETFKKYLLKQKLENYNGENIYITYYQKL